MLAVISPAKRLDAAPEPRDLPHTKPALMRDAEVLVDVARKLTSADLKRLMGISDPLADLNRQRFKAFTTPFKPGNAVQAIRAFKGDTYIGFDAESLGDDDLLYAQDHLRILSGLYGLLRPLDLIQPYRLEMGVKLRTAAGEDLYDFWGDRITRELNKAVKGRPDPVVVNLASNEYIKAVQPDKLKARLVTPVFKEVKAGSAKVVGIMAKKARGMMARFMIENRLSRPEDLTSFTEGGYRFKPALSDGNRLEFHRTA